MKAIAIVRLAPGQVGFFDDLTRIHLTISSPEKPVMAGSNTLNLRRAVKSGRLLLVSGTLSPETNVQPKPVDTVIPLVEKEVVQQQENVTLKVAEDVVVNGETIVEKGEEITIDPDSQVDGKEINENEVIDVKAEVVENSDKNVEESEVVDEKAEEVESDETVETTVQETSEVKVEQQEEKTPEAGAKTTVKKTTSKKSSKKSK